MENNSATCYESWLNSGVLTDNEIQELQAIRNNPEEIEERFYTDLSFGTGGMRGIRGVGRNRINVYTIRRATQGLANYIIQMTGEAGKKKGVAIAYDCRIGSVELAENAARVLAANGIKAWLFPTLHTTPELSFATRETKSQAGIMITASHNPREYNGYKVYWADGAQLVDPEATGVVDAVNALDIFKDVKIISKEEAVAKGLLVYLDKTMDDRYIEEVEKAAIHRDIPGKEHFKIVYSPLHGTARVPVQRVLKEMGFASVWTVPEQEMPDGNFPTAAYANPEDKNVFKLSTALADKVGATLCLANDPDGDRVGIAIKDHKGNWFYPTGNQIGILLIDYILTNKKDLPANGALVTTIVSTPMVDALAKAYHLKVFRTLTGFKYIGEKIREFEEKKFDADYVFGFEESIGYLINTHVRDKDSVVSSMLIAEMAAWYAGKGLTVYDRLEELYRIYGYYREKTISVTKEGKSGLEDIQGIMTSLRAKEHEEIAGKKVRVIRDYELQTETDAKGIRPIEGLPVSNVIQFVLEDGTTITARPSGTEPKIKYYLCVIGKTEAEAEDKLAKTEKDFLAYVEKLG
ncbi:MAG: phospho-sugar mutase [Fusobacteriaceae bacterium]|jgi:phosphoglucomutase|nr:phospho-sugar mutase [Fusobacteriaceae bacterium]